MMETTEYLKELSNALEKRRDWIEKTQLDKLKERIRAFYSAYNTFYLFLLKKGLIKEDPFKNEDGIQIGKIYIPKTSPFVEATKLQDISIRLADYDNQLKILADYYPLSINKLDFDQINLIMGLIKYIDWVSLTPDSDYPLTQAVAEIKNQVKLEVNSNLNAPLSLAKLTNFILGCLKVINDFNRERYKYEIRNAVFYNLPQDQAPSLIEVKKRFTAVLPTKPFYAELAEETINEDYSAEGPQLREKVLKSLAVAEEKPKTFVSNRTLLVDGVQIIGTISSLLIIIMEKFDYNRILLEDPEPNFWTQIKRFIDKIMSKPPEPAIYEVEYTIEENSTKSRGSPGVIQVKKEIVYEELRSDLEKRSQNLSSISFQGNALTKIEALPDDELLHFLERAIRGIISLYKILGAVDHYFKKSINDKYRDRIKGIKPELSAMKNAFIKANEKAADYTTLKEAEEVKKWLPRPQEEQELDPGVLI
ncbi:MAG: hypothetical protein LBD29_07385 [Treponema sp.]|jgi:hypothetical protein|nr:hypothetical protein [Treponema sp.]